MVDNKELESDLKAMAEDFPLSRTSFQRYSGHRPRVLTAGAWA
jgi:hypothetical protein